MVTLCEGIISRNKSAAWAYLQLGLLQLQANDAEAAVGSIQHGLRIESTNVEGWEVSLLLVLPTRAFEQCARLHVLFSFPSALRAPAPALRRSGSRLRTNSLAG